MSIHGTVYIVDDDASVRSAVSRLFRSIGAQVEAFEDASAFLRAERGEGPGCLLLDIEMPGASGLDLQGDLASHGVDLPIVFMTGHGDIPLAVEAMRNGAVDFLPKPVDDEKLIKTVLDALEHHGRALAMGAEVLAFRERIKLLTPREHEVLSLVVCGMLNKQIAAQLGISLVTVKVHRGRGVAKVEVDSVAELARMWDRAGIGAPG